MTCYCKPHGNVSWQPDSLISPVKHTIAFPRSLVISHPCRSSLSLSLSLARSALAGLKVNNKPNSCAPLEHISPLSNPAGSVGRLPVPPRSDTELNWWELSEEGEGGRDIKDPSNQIWHDKDGDAALSCVAVSFSLLKGCQNELAPNLGFNPGLIYSNSEGSVPFLSQCFLFIQPDWLRYLIYSTFLFLYEMHS